VWWGNTSPHKRSGTRRSKMRLIIIIVLLCVGLGSIGKSLDKINENIEKITRLLEAKRE
jgi:hypothetical protein